MKIVQSSAQPIAEGTAKEVQKEANIAAKKPASAKS